LTLAELYVEAQQMDAAIDIYRELAEFDPADEKLWRMLFQLHAERADLPALIREERHLRTALRELAMREGDAPNAVATEPSRELDLEFQRLVASLERPRRAASAG
jgi:DNA-binding SARP family transcriptional activator